MKLISPKSHAAFFCLLTACGHLPSAHAALVPTSQPWQSITPGAGGWFEAIGIGPSGVIVAASDLSGAYISTTNGSSWTAVGAPQGVKSTHISSVGFHKTDTNLILLGTDDGIYRSTNQGRTFSFVQADHYITSIQFAPNKPTTFYAAGHSAYNSTTPTIYISNNSGLSWQPQASSGLDNVRIQKLVVHPTRSNELYAISSPDRFANSPVRAIYRSTDNGQTWSIFGDTQGAAFDFAISALTPNDMYLSTTNGILYSSNAGSTWSNTGQPVEMDYFGNNVGYSLWLDPKNSSTIRLISNALSVWENKRWGVWMGTKKGSVFSWKFLNTSTNANFTKAGWDMPDYWHYNPLKNNDLWSHFYYTGESLRTIAVDPRNASRMIFVNAQWVFNTSDGGTKFSQYFTNASTTGWRTRGIENINTFDVAASRWKTGKNVIFGGYADMGCWRSLDSGINWESCNPVQYTPSAPIAATPSMRGIWQTLIHHSQSVQQGLTSLFDILAHGWLGLDNFRVQLAGDVAATGGWRGTGGNATAFAIDHAREGMVWAAIGDEISHQMTLVRSKNSGKFDSWQDASGGIAPEDQKHIYGISIDPNSPSTQRTMFLTANGEVYRSTDDGLNWTKVLSCRDRSGNLNYCVTTAVDYFDSKLVYAAGSAGLFVSQDGGDTWDWADNTHMTKPESLGDTFNAYLDRYLISGIATDPFTPGRVYLAILDTRIEGGNRGGIWTSDKGYNWQQLYANPYARSVAVSPLLKNELVATFSMAYTSGGYSPQSLGVMRYNPNGTWQALNTGLSYNNVSHIAYGTQQGRLVLGSMGQGVMRNWR